MSWSRLVSRILLLVLGLTVLSPHFAWEAMAPDAHHDARGAGLLLGADDHGGGEHPRFDHHDEHACGGHMMGHMPVQASSEVSPALLAGRDAYSHAVMRGFASRDPESFERPPRPRLA